MNSTKPEKKLLAGVPAIINRLAYYGYRSVRVLCQLIFDARFRSEAVSRLRRNDRQYQIITHTFDDRYPALFNHCKLYFSKYAQPKILSFGCSTGEEVFSLIKYLPEAKITGVDINHWCLKQCVKKNRSNNATFVYKLSREFDKLAGYDAIFCLAVFQRTEHRAENIKQIIQILTFDKFEEEIAILDLKLNAGGLLYIDHCDFRFEDTTTSIKYTPLICEKSKRVRDRPLFGTDNKLIALRYTAQRIFQKNFNK